MFTFNGYNIEPTGLAYNNRGSMTQDQNTTSEINAEALLGFDKKFGRLGVSVIAGGNEQKAKNQTLNLASGFFNVPSNTSSQMQLTSLHPRLCRIVYQLFIRLADLSTMAICI